MKKVKTKWRKRLDSIPLHIKMYVDLMSILAIEDNDAFESPLVNVI